MIDCFLGDVFVFFCPPIFEYCSAVWGSAAYIHLKLLDGVVSGACFLTVYLHVAVLCMLYKIRCNPMHSLYGPLPVPYVSVQVTRGALVHINTLMRFLAAEPLSTAGLSFPSQCVCGTIFLTLYSMVWDWPVSRAGPMLFCSKTLYSMVWDWPVSRAGPMLFSSKTLYSMVWDWPVSRAGPMLFCSKTLYSMVWDWPVSRAWPMLFCSKLLDPFLPSTVFPLSRSLPALQLPIFLIIIIILITWVRYMYDDVP